MGENSVYIDKWKSTYRPGELLTVRGDHPVRLFRHERTVASPGYMPFELSSDFLIKGEVAMFLGASTFLNVIRLLKSDKIYVAHISNFCSFPNQETTCTRGI
jgi:hypothetical protein